MPRLYTKLNCVETRQAASGWHDDRNMAVHSRKRVLALALSSLLMVGSASALLQSAGTTANLDDPSDSIPVVAVAVSGNCDRLADLEQQLEDTQESKVVKPVVGPGQTRPLGASGKFHLAFRNFRDPFNLAGMAIDSGISTATGNSTSEFGTGWAGFGRRFGMSVADAGVSEFMSTFLICTLAHEDPHYHRDPDASGKTRILYALSRVVITRSDSGKPMFNYAEFAGTTASSLVEIPYHFERDESPGAVASRIFVSIGSDAAWNLMNEFLPDIANHVNPRFIFLRRLAEHAAHQN